MSCWLIAGSSRSSSNKTAIVTFATRHSFFGNNKVNDTLSLSLSFLTRGAHAHALVRNKSSSALFLSSSSSSSSSSSLFTLANAQKYRLASTSSALSRQHLRVTLHATRQSTNEASSTSLSTSIRVGMIRYRRHHHRRRRRCCHGSTVISTISKRQKATLTTPLVTPLGQSASATPTAQQQATMTMTQTQQQQQQVIRKTIFQMLEEVLRKPRTIPIPRWITPQHYTITLAEVCGHSSFLLVACSYAVDDFLWLRMIAVAGSTAMLFFTYFHPHGRVLWLPFKWNCLFIAINSYRIGKVLLDRYYYAEHHLSAELRQLRQEHFYLMDPTDFARLMRLGTMRVYQPGDMVIAQGEYNRNVGLVVAGELRVLRDGLLNYILQVGNFVQEAGLHAGLLLPGKIESCCTIVAHEPARVMTWDRTELVELMERYPSLRRSMKAVLSWDIVRKLKAQRFLEKKGDIDDHEAWTERRSRQTFHRYAAILSNLLSHPQYFKEERKELSKYRQIHGIDDEYHKMALQKLGWTPEEFEAGRKECSDEDCDDDHIDDRDTVKHDLRWYVSTAIYRVFG